MPPTVRPYRPTDLEVCRALWVDLTERHREIYANPKIGGDAPEAQFDEHLENVGPDSLWVAELDDHVVGLTGLIMKGRDGEVEPVIVRPPHRGQGIGRLLCMAVIEAARERDVRLLSVRPVARNEEAIAFFHHLGFNVVGHIQLFMDLGPAAGQSWRPAPPAPTEGVRY